MARTVLLAGLVVSAMLVQSGHCFSCLVTLPSVLRVQEKHNVSVLAQDFTGRSLASYSQEDPAQVSVGVRRATDMASRCDFWNRQRCLVFNTSNTLRYATLSEVPIEIPTVSVPECTPGELIPVTVWAECRVDDGSSSTEYNVSLKCRQAKVLLQLDKPVYSAGQTVTIRGFFVDTNLHTVTQMVRLEIRNPSGVLLALDTYRPGSGYSKGFLQYKFDLSSEPQFGFWSVSITPVMAEGDPMLISPSRTTFEVKDYILPRFSVEVDLPPSITSLDGNGIPVEVAARYPFNSAVSGSVSIQAAVVWKTVRKPLTLNTTVQSLMRSSPSTKSYGTAKFEIPTSAIWSALSYTALPVGSCLEVEARVQDVSSLRRVKGMSRTCFVKHACHVNASILDVLVKPGLPYSSQVRIADYTGMPMVNKKVAIELEQSKSDFTVERMSLSVSSDDAGVAHFTLAGGVLRETVSAYLKVTTDCSATFRHPLTMCRTTASSCPGQVTISSASDKRAELKANIGVRIQLSESPTADTDVILLAVRGGSVLHSEKLRIVADNDNNAVEDSVYIMPEWSPGFYWLVYLICPHGEMLADSVYQPVEFRQKHKVSVNFEPKATIFVAGTDRAKKLKVQAENGSTLYMLTVDDSVYFMNSTNRITRESIHKEYTTPDYSTSCLYTPSCTSAYAFQKAGLATIPRMMTPASSSQPNPLCRKDESVLEIEGCCQLGTATGRRAAAVAGLARQLCTKKSIPVRVQHGSECAEIFLSCCMGYKPPSHDPNRLRTLGNFKLHTDVNEADIYERHWFPPTIVDRIEMDKSAQLVPFNIPDTITGWTMQAIAVHHSYPLTVAKDLKFLVDKEFFLEMHMPSSLVKGEQFSMRLTLYSRSNEPMRFTIYLLGDRDYCSVAGGGRRSTNASVVVPARGSVSLSYVITPLVTGKVMIGAKALIQGVFAGASDSDFITKEVTVKPRGVRISTQCDNYPIVLKRGDTFSQAFNFTLPKDYIHGTVQPVVKLMGGVLGHLSRLDGLEGMLEMPLGCGEQNMLKFSVNTFVLRYLTQSCGLGSSGVPLDESIRRKALKFMKEGYQRQLNYQRDDGSFSAFGNKDKAGNTWLTAFVVKTFCSVDPTMYDEIPIDDDVINRALHYLAGRQTFGGAFTEAGEILDECMKGGNAGYRPSDQIDYQLTAYVTVSILECRARHPKVEAIALGGARYLARGYSTLVNAYDVALTSYALALAGEAIIQPAIVKRKLASFAQVIDGADCDVSHQRTPQYLGRGCTGVYIETSAYAMLAEMRLGTAVECGQCYVNWLTKWRKQSGGFVSTQDTVLAIQAISEYLCCHTGEELQQDMMVTVRSQKFRTAEIGTHQHNITAFNKDLEQSVDLQPDFRDGMSVQVDVSGEGRATLLHCLKYNVERNERQCNFTIETTLRESNCRPNVDVSRQPDQCKISMYIKIRLDPNTALNKTGMAIVEVQLISGFTVDPEYLKSLQTRTAIIKRVERHGQTVLVYLDRVTKKWLSFRLNLQRTDLMGLVQPAIVKVYDYYNPGISCHKFYNVHQRSSMLSVLCRDRECLCGAGECMCPDSEKMPIASSRVKDMAKMVCKNDYAWKIKVVRIAPLESGWVKLKATIERSIKQGERDVTQGDTVSLFRPSHCRCPKLKVGSSYLITGLDRGLKLVLDKNTQMEKWTTKSQRICWFTHLMITRPGVCDDVDKVWKEYRQSSAYKKDCLKI